MAESISSTMRVPAEWEQCEAILMALPHSDTDWDATLDDVLDCYRRMVAAMTSAGERVIMLCPDKACAYDILGGTHGGRLLLLEIPYNDTWTRDYGPITIERHGRIRALDFAFNGWGLKFSADRDNLVNHILSKAGLYRENAYRSELDYVLEGGSIDTDGKGTVLTTSRCLLSPNRNGFLSKDEAAEELNRRLGFEHVLWLDYGSLAGDDTDSHIDTLARMAPEDTIIFTGCHDAEDSHFASLQQMRSQLQRFRTAEGNAFNLVEIPLPDAIYDNEGMRLPATYANYLITPGNVFVPIYGQPQKDMLALRTLQTVFTTRKVVGIDCRALVVQHGSLHCATMQLPAGILNPGVFDKINLFNN